MSGGPDPRSVKQLFDLADRWRPEIWPLHERSARRAGKGRLAPRSSTIQRAVARASYYVVARDAISWINWSVVATSPNALRKMEYVIAREAIADVDGAENATLRAQHY
jgi:hypothetical protein